MRKYLLPLSILLLLILAVLGGVGHYYYGQRLQRIDGQLQAQTILLKGVQKISDIWNQAPGQFACGELKKLVDVDLSYFKNNPDYLNCFLSKGKILVRHRDKEFYVMAKRFPSGRYYRVVTHENDDRPMIPNYGVEVELMVEGAPKGLSLAFILEPQNSEVYLPQRVYGFGPFVEKGDWRFDTFGRHIFIDKFMVSFRDIAEWVYFAKDKNLVSKVKFPTNQTEWVKPASGLTIEQMTSFCAFRGKQLLPAHLYDAATFFPPDQEDLRPAKIVRGPYPWTYQRRMIFTNEESFESSWCSKIYSASCIGQAGFDFFDTRSNSWIGLSQVLGGYMEYLPNTIQKGKNIKASSFYFDFRSPWHQLGMRASWDGEAWAYRNFDWSGGDEPVGEYQLYKTGFRCMREVSHE